MANVKAVEAKALEASSDKGLNPGALLLHSQVVKIKEEDEDLLRLSPRERLAIFNFSSQMKDFFLAGNSGRPVFRSPLGLNRAEPAASPCGIQATR
ncbi:hypothetical protein SUGI_0075280 [Cryptomeria japonica]|nr:hypothetical protein SUGI_0075280 [Cryptomeria japonica]